MLIDSAAMTVAGKTKADNEENCYLNGKYKYDIEEKYKSMCDLSLRKRNVYAVFRGSGGGEYGEIAALIGASVLKKFQNKDINKTFDRYVAKANNEICKYILDSDGRQSAAAVSLLYIGSGEASVFNIGDGCVFHLHKGKLKKITAESSAEKLGKFANEEPVIFERTLNIQISESDKFLLCSGELSDKLSDSEILRIMKQKLSAREITDELLKKAVQNGAEGTLTAITADCLSEEKSVKKTAKFHITVIAAAVVLIFAIAAACAVNGNKIFSKDSESVKSEKVITEKKKEKEHKKILPEDNEAENKKIEKQPDSPEQNSEPVVDSLMPMPKKRGNSESSVTVTEKKAAENTDESKIAQAAQKIEGEENSQPEAAEAVQESIPEVNGENQDETSHNEDEQLPEDNQSKTDMER